MTIMNEKWGKAGRKKVRHELNDGKKRKQEMKGNEREEGK